MDSSLEKLLLVPYGQRNRSWLHRTLRSLLWSEAIAPLLEMMGCGWLDGGCHSCAKGLLQYLQQSNMPHEVLVEKVVIADAYSRAQHVVIGIIALGREWYLDANGVSTREEILSYWEQEEQVFAPRIERIDDEEWLEEEIASLGYASWCVQNLLQEKLGHFSLHWLEDNAQAGDGKGATQRKSRSLPLTLKA
jgi:hypothetical protein